MRERLTREDARNVRVEVLLTANAADFARNVTATAKIADLQATNAATQQERQNQIGGTNDIRQDYGIYADDFDAMVADMETIRDFAIPLSRVVAGLEDKFRIPRTGGKGAKIAAAYVFVKDGETVGQSFFDGGLDKDFFTNLKTKADAAQQGLNAAQTSTGKRSGATSALETNVKTASRTVEDMRPIVNYIYRDNPAKLAEWMHAAKVESHTPTPTPKPPPK